MAADGLGNISVKSRSAHSFWLAMGLIVGATVHWVDAGEKILFSTGKKDTPKDNLAIKQAKPVLQTLDFYKMGGRGSKAEELAPMLPPPEMAEEDLTDSKEKQQDKNWLLPEDKRNQYGKNSKDGKDRDKSKDRDKDRDRDRDDREKDRRDNEPYDLDQREKDPFYRRQDEDPLQRLRTSGSSTNRIVFGSANRRDDQVFRPDRAEGAPVREMGLPPGAGPNPLGEQSRTATLERLGLSPLTSGSAATSVGNGNANGASGMFGLGNLQSSGSAANNGQLGSLGQPASMRDAGARQMGGRDTAFKSGLMNEIGTLNLGQSSAQPRVYEAPKYERKPAVLPVPQRKF